MIHIIKALVVFWGILPMQAQALEAKKSNPSTHVYKHILSNGMTILVRPITNTIPKVSTQLWYNVGSKDEKDQERGIAHLIEHMIFKGTKKLSESDLDSVTRMLSGSCNAFTSYDYTGYLFNFPTQHWEESLRIMSDCMRNCSFKDYMLNSEMKAVIQELKMYRDHYDRSLVDEMISAIFHDHPYHHPIIGYKQDLWTVTSQDLKAFYKKHYVPNNATLVVVGDVNPQEVFEKAEQLFGSIPADWSYKKREFYFNQDICAKSVTLYRDIQQPLVVFAFLIPGIKSHHDAALELLSYVIGSGKGSRLYKRLFDKEQLVTSISASSEELFDYGLFFIVAQPKKAEDIPLIESIIAQEIERLKKDGIKDAELDRAIKKTEMSLHSLMENFEHQAYEIGKYYVALGDENYLFNYLSKPKKEIKEEILELLSVYLRAPVMHKGTVLPLPESERPVWETLQEEAELEDARILAARQRLEPVEPPRYAHTVSIKEPKTFAYPKAQCVTLENGLRVLYYNNPHTPKINLILDLKAKHHYDPIDQQGISLFVSKMLLEGTKHYTQEELVDAIENRGMTVSAYAGGIAMSMLKEDLEFGLTLLYELLVHASFDAKEIEKIRQQLIAQLKNFWDDPRYFAGQLVKEKIYKDHPYSKNSLGTIASIESIKERDLKEFYTTHYSPDGARLAIVGDLSNKNVPALVEKALGKWQFKPVASPNFPELAPSAADIVDYIINRDQVALRFASKSINRMHPDYDKLLLFDQIFSGGVLGPMSSRLFKLREQSGLFYTIGGSLIAGADEQPGMVLVQTIVSLDRLAEAEDVIKKTIEDAANTITEKELHEARRGLINAQTDSFSSNYNIANAFLFLDRYQLSPSYFDKRADTLNAISIDQVKQAAQNILKNKLLTLRVGRINKAVKCA